MSALTRSIQLEQRRLAETKRTWFAFGFLAAIVIVAPIIALAIILRM